MSATLSRREFLRFSALTAAGIAAAACAKTPTEAPQAATPTQAAAAATPTQAAKEEPTATPAPAGPTEGQAPMLQEQVAAGTLPDVQERLPGTPLVLPVVEEIGQYGGTWRRAWKGAGDTGGPARLWPEAMVHFSPDGTEFQPNVFTEWEATEMGSVYTFKLRAGLKWSDGVPVTADDFTYWYNDELLNEELNPSTPSWMKAGGEMGTIEKVDDFTVRFAFAAPFPLFILRIAEPILAPAAHYKQQFHPNYVDQATLDKMASDAGFENWYELYADKGDLYDNPELPLWDPWVVTTDAAAQRYLAGRNAYYFKVDPDGNQLPYLDEIAHDLVEETELYLTKAIAGELDMQGRFVGDAANYPILKENEEKGDYHIVEWTPTLGNSYQVMFNQSYDADPVVAKYITDKKFRQALSVAIDRADFIEIVSLGQGTPRQVTVMDISPDFKAEYATRYIELDLDKANAWLDELGLDQKDAEGFRIAPESGEALTLTISCIPDHAQNNELIKEYWAKVGIKTVVKSEERSVHYERMASNELQLSTWGMDGALYPLWLNYAYWIVPWIQGSSRIGPAFGLWRDTNGEQGKEPTGDMAKALELFDQAVAEVDEEKRIALASQVLDIASEGVWSMGTYLLAKGFFLVKNNFHNVPESAVSDWILRTPKNTHTEQYFKQS
jgi:peptide/nickel transport system substrate-binding protein